MLPKRMARVSRSALMEPRTPAGVWVKIPDFACQTRANRSKEPSSLFSHQSFVDDGAGSRMKRTRARMGHHGTLVTLATLACLLSGAVGVTEDIAGAGGGAKREETQCLSMLNPPGGGPYELADDEWEEFNFLLNINCAGMEFGETLSVETGTDAFEVATALSSELMAYHECNPLCRARAGHA